MKALTSLVALVAASLSLVPATAQSAPPGGQSQIVHYGDLDLGRPEGVRALDNRLRVAIERACGPTSPADPIGTRMARECRATLREATAERRAQALAGVARPEPITIALVR